MHHSLTINNNTPFSFEAFHKVLGIKLQLNFTADFNQATYYYFTQKDSVTLFCLVDNRQGTLELCMDALASYSDYRLFPYLADTLHHFVNGGRLVLTLSHLVSRIKKSVGRHDKMCFFRYQQSFLQRMAGLFQVAGLIHEKVRRKHHAVTYYINLTSLEYA